MKATKDGSELGVYEGGSMMVTTSRGEQMVTGGKRIMLAQLPSTSGFTGGASFLSDINGLELAGAAVLATALFVVLIAGSGGDGDSDNKKVASNPMPPAP